MSNPKFDLTIEPRAYWYVWNKKGRIPWKKHLSEADAQIEASRLARVAPGTTFYILHCHEAITVSPAGGDA